MTGLTEQEGRLMAEDARAHSRGRAWEAMHRTLAADAVVAEAEAYASGWRKLTVDHGEPLTSAARALLVGLLEQVDQAVSAVMGAAGPRVATVTCRATSITWAFPSGDRSARELVLLARTVVDQVDPGGWVVTADDHP